MSEARAKEIISNTSHFWSQFINEDYAQLTNIRYNFLGKSTLTYLFACANVNNIEGMMEMDDLAGKRSKEFLEKQGETEEMIAASLKKLGDQLERLTKNSEDIREQENRGEE